MTSTGHTFRKLLSTGPVPLPGAFNPLVGRMIAASGFQAAYLSGAAFSAGQLALPDVGLFGLAELAEETRRLTRACDLPILVDADTGFGEALAVERTMRELEDAGAAAIQIEDQELPKRCGHLSGKSLISTDAMCAKIRAAVAARRDPATMLVARTDARGVTNLEEAILRARAYVAAGADAIFPEALTTREEYVRFRQEIQTPLIANMTEFGKSPLLSLQEWGSLGYNGVLFPVTLLRVALRGVQAALRELRATGTQAGFLSQLQTRQELYDLLGYQDYETRDQAYFGNL
ncbi:MAG: methylisocitrate lyase [Pirellulales bacterium]|nr:methylisocitrate lyase [Pirellulales bacterium]